MLKKLWIEITPVNEEEMCFSLYGSSPRILVRNWLTFLVRELIIRQEKAAFYNNSGMGNLVQLRHTFNARVIKEVCDAYQRLKHEKRIDIFHSKFNPDRVFLVNPNRDVQPGNIVRVIQVNDS